MIDVEDLCRVKVPKVHEEACWDNLIVSPPDARISLVDASQSVGGPIYALVIEASITRNARGGILMKLKEYIVEKSASLEIALEHIDSGIELVYKKNEDLDDQSSLRFSRLKVMLGSNVLIEVPFERSFDASQEDSPGEMALRADKAMVVGADLSDVDAFSRIVPGANGRNLRGQILESALGL